MQKPVLRLILVLTIALIAVAAHADPEGPGYGQDPDQEPPRTGVGSANSGNHNMHVENHRNRWSYGVDESAFVPEGTLPQASATASQEAVVADLVVQFNLLLGLFR